MEKVLLFYYLPLSMLGLGVFAFDKWRALYRRRRVSERSLLLLSTIGAWPGAWLGIVLFRHKSAKRVFLFQFAIGILLHCAITIAIWRYLLR